MRMYITAILIAAVVATAIVLVLERIRPPPGPPPVDVLTIEQIQPLASLLTTRIQIADAVVQQLEGYTGTLRLAAVIKGDVLIRVDLTQARIDQLDRDRRTATLILPAPQTLSPRIDHEGSRVIAVHTTGLWQIVPTDAGRSELFDRAMKHAQQRVAGAGAEQEMIDQSRRHAEELICGFADDVLGWRIEVIWRDRAEPP